MKKKTNKDAERFTFGVMSNLHGLRLKREISQEALAQRAGVDRKTVNRIENGHFSPSIETLVRISVSLNSKIPSLV